MKAIGLNFLQWLLCCWTMTAFGGSTTTLFESGETNRWYTWLGDTKYEDPRHVFSVTNGVVHISGDGLGYLATKQSYSSYLLRAEFRWGERNFSWGDRIGKARDSGVFLHATGPDGNSHDGNGAFMAAIECNIFQGATGDFLLIRGNAGDGTLIAPSLVARVKEERDPDGWFTWDPNGRVHKIERWGRLNWRNKAAEWRDVLDFRGPREVEKRRGEWNGLAIRCEGERIEVTLNGVLVNRAEKVYPSAGRILLQCEGSEIYFRNILLEQL